MLIFALMIYYIDLNLVQLCPLGGYLRQTLKKCTCELHADCGCWHAFLRCYTQIWKARKSVLSSAERVPF